MHHRTEKDFRDLRVRVIFTYHIDNTEKAEALKSIEASLADIRRRISAGEESGELTLHDIIRQPKALWRAHPIWWGDRPHPRWWEAPFCGKVPE
jgi:hypothetical protein